MWIISKNGFISCVKHRTLPDTIEVRARVEEDLVRYFPDFEVQTKIGADYIFRMQVPVSALENALVLAARDIDYDSHVKEVVSAAAPKPKVGNRYSAMLATWNAFALLQPYAPYAKAPRPVPKPWKASTSPMLFTDRVSTGTGGSHRPGNYDWSSHPQSSSYVGPETIVPDDDYADVPDEAYSLSDDDWDAFLVRRETDKAEIAKAKTKARKARRRGGRKHHGKKK